ncbi:hypothetical protein A2U01_0056468 [Trifolium medium]|uniref:Transmembrane protein n=1 Tax=Trifolium medium TaxID=97028 RepID=A0A392RGA7_9FABA|nr:hypothetical protein [Trifolium medium]
MDGRRFLLGSSIVIVSSIIFSTTCVRISEEMTKSSMVEFVVEVVLILVLVELVVVVVVLALIVFEIEIVVVVHE